MNKSNLLKIRITLYVIIVILGTIIIYSKYAPKELDMWIANHVGVF
ncbi:MAG: hypothetical protein PHG82_00035 [Candidatus Gracilibacteria bacterium]|nr:hypothetical protein [Candidatus Gracilibacteria bacterium]